MQMEYIYIAQEKGVRRRLRKAIQGERPNHLFGDRDEDEESEESKRKGAKEKEYVRNSCW